MAALKNYQQIEKLQEFIDILVIWCKYLSEKCILVSLAFFFITESHTLKCVDIAYRYP